MTRSLILSPQAGFGNRIRFLCTGILLGAFLDRKVYHYWVPDRKLSHVAHVNHMKSIGPDYIFDLGIPLYDGTAVDVCFSEWMPGDFWYEQQSTAQSALTCRQTSRLTDLNDVVASEAETILLESSLEALIDPLLPMRSQLMHAVYKQHFRFSERWAQLAINVPSFDIGVSIRRGNYLEYHPDADVAVDMITALIRDEVGSKIIFSDDEAYARALRSRLSAPFVLEDARQGEDVPDRYISEFVVLSQCKCIMGTKGSSFPEQAAIYGGIPIRSL